ncbi:succinylglutamate desuccinylase/aspartoacylase family protein [Roseinatronobacter sp.]|uniref:succinylglutamate desuccinylase/aspartoacylase family protein n=1 Tax=Roseinatronobacter sp. TaxID=1945755 RepID=UPI0025F713DD|nr:succinylglutamate desuccinylase/aspartoacylase family protein [Rhodobaca sp.]
MHEHRFKIPGRGPGITHEVLTLSFGDPTARPYVYVQAGLHADEAPGMMAARMLVDMLAKAEADGILRGHVKVVPFANPLALGQVLHGDLSGRFDLYDGRNFNRDYPDLTEDAARALQGQLGDDPQANAHAVRSALADALAQRLPVGPADTLRHHLMAQGIGADVVLDLHCDGEAEMHLYTQPAAAETFAPLAALTGCRAMLVADVSGGHPFDEALSRPWASLAARLPDHPIPLGCVSCTVELRGRADVCRDLGMQDAQAIMDYMIYLGVLEGSVDLPQLACAVTPLEGSEALTAPVAGLLSYVAALGAYVERGETVAQITDLETGAVTSVAATTSGVFYSRPATRIAEAGKRLGKIAGAVSFRDGPLLSP